MSNYWHLRCLDCKSDCEFPRGNHVGEALIELWNGREAIIAAAFAGVEVQADYQFELRGIDEGWWRDHKDHDVKPFSEYGYAWDECTEYVECGECGHRERCGLKDKHKGPHGRPKRKGA